MDISDKLSFYKSSSGNETHQPSAVSSSLKTLADHFNGKIVYPHAPYLKIVREESLGDSLQDAVTLKLLSRNEINEPLALDGILFFDLETTGLAGGAGTYAFLLGFGRIAGNRIIVEQYFLPDYGREYHLFEQLNLQFNEFSCLVSYNGKSYDYPLLRSRFLLNRQKFKLEDIFHVDLLHIARRLWKDSLPSCDLKSIETEILGVNREGDIPGAYIPQAYFNFIRTGIVHEVIRIVNHNYTDITSLARMLLYFSQIENNPLTAVHHGIQARLAKLAYEAEDYTLLQKLAGNIGPDSPAIPEVKKMLSLFCKRSRNWPEALSLWNELVNSASHRFFALEELAKYYEHIEADYKEAIKYTSRALSIIRALEEIQYDANTFFYKESFQYRYQRLVQKSA
ncbi:MAG: ribonuclease H-like domain-containing protein [Calditrichaceae bacterium]|nr:ribonuclease H-like domain-containing protein [Calditrichaceae bacterium]MBN2708809.1 ribonuclease H-like domain-containing protein [Calditrichaceae bacterium]RQV97662.1 MAG: hypothetical protein EH224_01190 [Calditrichota bacterium]